ncbi:MAG TPA: cell envelope integrity protein TolA [Steroidobacteraceae bacterium]|nr:cell envelope integrity protein TolA [Steroidobacteraceae bacterium]
MLSVLLHGGLIGVFVYGWLLFRSQTQPVRALAINATVVDSRVLAGVSKPAPTPPVPAPTPPPTATAPPPPAPPTPAPQPAPEPAPAPKPPEAAQKAAEQRAAQEKAAKAAAALAAAEEAKRKAEEKKRQAEEAKRKAEEERFNADSQADLRRSLQEEEKVQQATTNGQLASWLQQIASRIESSWHRPPSARPGIDCTVFLTQVPGGQIVNVKLESCNGDAAVKQSIVDAAYRASPLPPPPDPALFQREVQVRFVPRD